jgi:acyl carrier protein
MDADTVRQRVYARTAELAGLSAEDIGAETTLDSAGLDSSDAVILAMEVEELTGKEIDVGIFLRFTTLGEAVEELLRVLRAANAPAMR